MTELILNTGEFIDESDSEHDVILNRLDLRHDNNGNSFLYDADEFRSALPLFKETPLIFAKVHPKNIGKLSLEDALAEVDGRFLGTPQDVLVNETGTLFRGRLSISDPEVKELVKKGKALLSTAFSAIPDENGVLRNIIPNHILVYPADTNIPPGDHAALFLNQNKLDTKEVDLSMADDIKTDPLELARELIQNQTAREELQSKLTEQTELVINQKIDLDAKDKAITEKDALLAEKDKLITNQSTEIETLNGKITELSQAIAETKLSQKKAKRDKIFNQFLNGTRKAFEARKEEIYDDEKFEDIFSEMFLHQSGAPVPETDESGSKDVYNQLPEDSFSEETEKAWNTSNVRF